jgi:hypothetical protein
MSASTLATITMKQVQQQQQQDQVHRSVQKHWQQHAMLS